MDIKELELPGLELVDPNAEYSDENQIFYIDFDGAENVSYDNDVLDIHIDGITVSSSNMTEDQQFQIISELNDTFAGSGVSFTTNSSLITQHSAFSTIYVGETTSASGECEYLTADFYGVAETIDVGNQIQDDNAFVITSNLDSLNLITETVSHEAGHLLGFRHVNDALIDAITDFAAVETLSNEILKLTATEANEGSYGRAVSIDGNNFVIGDASIDIEGKAYVYRWTGSYYDEFMLAASDGYGGQAFGWSTAISGDTVVVGTSEGLSDTSVYVYRWNGVSYDEVKLTASDGEEGDMFGHSVAVSGDTVVVGAFSDKDQGDHTGSAYVYRWNGVSYDEIKLMASDAHAENAFGCSVAIDGDNIVVGTDDGANAYVYRWNGVSYDEIKLVAPDVNGGNCSVDISGDTVVVGASRGFSEQGIVYVYRWNGISYEQTTISAPDIEGDDLFGCSVSVSGDTVLVGDEVNNGSGAVYVYNWNGSSYDEIKLNVPDGEIGGYFGCAVSISQDLMIVGNLGGNEDGSGSAYLFDLGAPDVPMGLRAPVDGDSVAMDWDDVADNFFGIKEYEVEYADNSQFTDAVSTTVTSSELALDDLINDTYFWRVRAIDNAGNASEWSSSTAFILNVSDTQVPDTPDNLYQAVDGTTVTLDWDDSTDNITGSGIKEYIVEYSLTSDFAEVFSYSTSGSQYQFDNLDEGTYYWRVKAVDNNNNESTWASDAFAVMPAGIRKLIIPGLESYYSLSISGDTVIVNYRAYDFDRWSGSPYVYRWDGAAYVGFRLEHGYSSIAGSQNGDLIVTGASENDDNGESCVYIYRWNGSSYVESILASSDEYEVYLGGCVDVDGNNVVVGAIGYDFMGQDFYGSAYVYRWNGSDYDEFRLTASDGEEWDFFGACVAIDGDTVVVGTSAETLEKRKQVYVYHWNGSGYEETIIKSPNINWSSECFLAVSGENIVIGSDNHTTAYRWNGLSYDEYILFDSGTNSVAIDGDTIVVGQDSSVVICIWNGLSYSKYQLYAPDGEYFGDTVSIDGDSVLISGNDAAYVIDLNEVITLSSDDIAPDTPTIVATLSDDTGCTLSWSSCDDETADQDEFYEVKYHYQIASDSSFSNIEKWGETYENDCVISDLFNDTYFWRVRAIDNAGNASEWSSSTAFILNVSDTQVPDTPDNLYQAVDGTTVTLDWDDSTDNITGSGIKEYIVEYSLTSDFAEVFSYSTSCSQYQFDNLDEGTYYWRVKAVDNNNNESTWASDAFAVMPAGIRKLIIPGLESYYSLSISGDTVIVNYRAYDFDRWSGSPYVYRWDGAAYVGFRLEHGYSSIAGSQNGDLIVTGASENDDNGESCVYIYRWNGSSYVESILASSDEYEVYLGGCVDVDGNNVVVGAIGYDFMGQDFYGSAYVYRWNGSDYDEFRLTASDGEEWDFFGACVAIDGDTVVVGTSAETLEKRKQVYVYHWNGSGYEETIIKSPNINWSSECFLAVSGENIVIGSDNHTTAYRWNGLSYDEYILFDSGTNSVAIDGDTIVVGQDSSVVICIWNGLSYSKYQLYAPDGEYFGDTVSIDGDSVLISGNDAAYVIDLNEVITLSSDDIAPDTPTIVATLSDDTGCTLSWSSCDDETADQDEFYEVKYHYQIASDSSFSNIEKWGETYENDCVISDLFNDTYFWRVRAIDNAGNASEWSSSTAFILNVSDTQVPDTPDNLYQAVDGTTVTLDWDDSTDNITGSGIKEYIVEYSLTSDFAEVFSYSTSCSQYQFDNLDEGTYYWRVKAVDNNNNESTWASDAFAVMPAGIRKLIIPGLESYYSLSISGDTVIVNYRAYDFDRWSGSPYVYRWDGAAYVGFRLEHGYSSIAGSQNGDLIVTGASENDDNGESCVYIYRWNGSSYVESILASSDEYEVYLGGCVDVDGNNVVVGAIGYDFMGQDFYGSAYVYRWNGSDYDEFRLTASDGEEWDFFGACVAIDGDTVVVGTSAETLEKRKQVYVYHWNGSGYEETIIKSPNINWSSECFLAVSGENIVIGSDNHTTAYRWNGLSYDEYILFDSGTNSVAIDGDTIVVGQDSSVVICIWNGLSYSKYQLYAPDGEYFGDTVSIDGDSVLISGNDAAYVIDLNEVITLSSDDIAPDTPTIVATLSDDTGCTLSWSSCDDETADQDEFYEVKYHYQIASDSSFSNIEKWGETYENDCVISDLFNDTYFWRVRAIDNAGNASEWSSSTVSFTIEVLDTQAPSQPDGLSDQIVGNTVNLDWDDSTDNNTGVAGYMLEFADNSDFTGAISLFPDMSEYVNNAFVNGSYFWRVKSIDVAGNESEWSEPASFEVTNDNLQITVYDSDSYSNGYSFSIDGNGIATGSISDGGNSFMVYRWNGLFYDQYVLPEDTNPDDDFSGGKIKVDGDAVYIVKGDLYCGNEFSVDFYRWDGDSYTVQNTPALQYFLFNDDYRNNEKIFISDDLIAIGCDSGNDVESLGIPIAYIYRWNGSYYDEYSFLVPRSNAGFTNISVDGDNVVMTVTSGYDQNDESSDAYTYVFRWNDGTGSYDRYKLDPLADISVSDYTCLFAAYQGDTVAIGIVDAYSSGCVYVYHWNGSGYEKTDVLIPDAAPVGFGDTVAIYDNNIVVGSFDDGGDDNVYVYRWNGSGYDEYIIQAPENDGSFSWFGAQVLIDGDIVTVKDDNQTSYYYHWNGTEYESYDITASIGDWYSSNVAQDGNMVLVGAPSENENEPGQVYVYMLGDDGAEQFTLIAPNAEASFGAVVDIDGDTAVVSSVERDGEKVSVYVFDISGPDAPVNLADPVTGDSVTLDWDDVADNLFGVKEYVVEYADNDQFTDAINVTVSSSALELDDLTDVTTYYWRVKAVDNLGNESAWSVTDSFDIDIPDTAAPSVPTDLINSVTNDSVTLNWEDSSDNKSGIKEYVIEYADNSSFTGSSNQTVSVSEFDLASLDDGTYYWHVKAEDNSGNQSAWSSTDNFTVDTTAPTLPSGLTTAVTGNDVALDWNDSTDATTRVDHYTIEYTTAASFTTAVSQDVAASNLDLEDLGDGTYHWRVQAVDAEGNASSWISGADFTVDITAPEIPISLDAVVIDNDVSLDWDDASDNLTGTKEYVVEYADNDQLTGAISQTVTVSELDLSGLTDMTTYYWRVRAVDNNGNESAWSAVDNFSIDVSDIQAPDVPTGLSDIVTNDNVALNWDDSSDNKSGIKEYVVEYADNQVFTDAISATVISSELELNSLTDMTTYYWRVKAVDNSGNESGWSNADSFDIDIPDTLAPEAPGTLTINISSNSVALSWNNSADNKSGLKEYVVQYADNADFTGAASETIVTSELNISDLVDGIYFWRVNAVDNAGNTSAWTIGTSFTIDITAPDVPAGLSDSVTDDSVILDWNDVSDNLTGIKEYVLEYADNASFAGSTSLLVNASECNLDNLSDLTTYYWRVKAIDNNDNESDWSVTDSFEIDIPDTQAPAIPAGLTQAVNTDSATLDWADSIDNKSGVKEYVVEYSMNVDFTDPVSQTVTTSELDIGSLADGNYYWRVKAVDNAGNTSDWSSSGSFIIDIPDIIAPGTPGNTLDSVDGSSITLEWTESTDNKSGIKEYIVEYSTNALFSDAVSHTVVGGELNETDIADGTYFWRVKAVDNAGNESDWSSVDTFVVDVTAPDIPASLTFSVDGNTATLDWADSTDNLTGLSGYIVAYGLSSDFSDATIVNADSSDIDLDNLADGIYSWRIRAVDNNDNASAWNIGNLITIDTTAPDIPEGLVDSVSGSNASLDWSDSTDNITGVKEYIVEYADNADFTDSEIASSQTSNLDINNLADGTWYWRTKSVDNTDNESDWSAVSSFDVDTLSPNAPTGLTGLSSLDGVSFNWNDSADNLSGVKEYIIEYAMNQNFVDALSESTINSELDVSDLVGGYLYWRVKAIDNNDNGSDWSNGNPIMIDNIGDSFASATSIDIDECYTCDEYVGLADAYDYYKFELVYACEFDFALTGLDDKALICLYEFDGTKYKKVMKTSAREASTSGIMTAEFGDILLDTGTYYIEVTSGDKGRGRYNTDYTLEIYADPLPAPSLDEFDFNNGTGTFNILELDDTGFVMDSGWVGFGDMQDVYCFTPESSGLFNIELAGLNSNTTMKVWYYDEDKGSYKGIKGAKGSEKTGFAELEGLLLSGDTDYYVEIISGDKGKGKCNTEYDLFIEGAYFPETTDNNTWQNATEIVPDVQLDGFVGFGDACDCYKFEVASLTSFDFDLTGEDKNAKLTLYRWDENKDKLKKVAKTSLKYGEASIDNLNLDAGIYYVEVLSADKGKGKKNTEYELDITVV